MGGGRGEVRLLDAVARVSPLPIPEPSFAAAAEQRCLAYFRLPGRPLIELPPAGQAAHDAETGAGTGELLAAPHQVPVGPMEPLVDVGDEPASAWLDEAADTYASIVSGVPTAHRPAVEAFLGAPPAGGHPLVFSHNDLGIEHVLVDDTTWTLTGVIDWSDAAICDPARDFGLLYRDLGATALRSATRCGAVGPAPGRTPERSPPVPPSTPSAASWRTWPTGSRPGAAAVSTRASPR